MMRTPATLALSALLLAAAAPAAAQTPEPASPDTTARPVPAGEPDPVVGADTTAGGSSGPSPGGSFARSLLVPGWGQAAHGAYLRGGVYFAAQAASGFMVLKTMVKLGEARDMAARRSAYVRQSELEANPGLRHLEDPVARDSLDALVAADSVVADRRALVEAREQQREDWIAWAVVWTLASGIDAFVTAHLSDFPVGVVAEPRQGGGTRVGLRLPLGAVP